MKRIIALILLFSSCLCLFACNKKDNDRDYDISVADDTGIKDAFSVKEKKRTYNGKDIEILYVKNNTENEYFITVNGSFLDTTGENPVPDTERTKTLFKNSEICFVFQPGEKFDRFEYKISSEKKSSLSGGAITISPYVTVDVCPHPVDVNEGYEKIRATAMYTIKIQNDFPNEKFLRGIVVLFDNAGEIVTIENYYKSATSGVGYYTGQLVLDTLWEDGMKTPENLEGQLEIVLDYELFDEYIR